MYLLDIRFGEIAFIFWMS